MHARIGLLFGEGAHRAPLRVFFFSRKAHRYLEEHLQARLQLKLLFSVPVYPATHLHTRTALCHVTAPFGRPLCGWPVNHDALPTGLVLGVAVPYN